MFIKPDDTESLKNGIKKLLENTIFADKIAEQAYYDVQKYTWGNRAKNILEFLKK
jgi:glycosyltransferase involved in cell wall biosynthesis